MKKYNVQTYLQYIGPEYKSDVDSYWVQQIGNVTVCKWEYCVIPCLSL